MSQEIVGLSEKQENEIKKEIDKYEEFCRSIPSLITIERKNVDMRFLERSQDTNTLLLEFSEVLKALAKANMWREGVLLRINGTGSEQDYFFTDINSLLDYEDDPQLQKIFSKLEKFDKTGEWKKLFKASLDIDPELEEGFDVLEFMSFIFSIKMDDCLLWNICVPFCRRVLERVIQSQLIHDDYNLWRGALDSAEEDYRCAECDDRDPLEAFTYEKPADRRKRLLSIFK